MPPQSVFVPPPPNRSGAWDWRSQFTVVDPTDKEVITQAIWERQFFVTAATQVLTFFQAASNGVNGNLQGNGQLTAGNFMRVQAIRVAVFVPPTQTATAASADARANGSLNDLYNITTLGTALLQIGDKRYGRWPLWMLPGGGGPVGQAAPYGTAAAGSEGHMQFATNGLQDPRAVYSLPINIGIPPQYNFTVTLEWAATIALFAGTVAGVTGVPITVVLDGQLMRPKQ
jgi:hypothetical protein